MSQYFHAHVVLLDRQAFHLGALVLRGNDKLMRGDDPRMRHDALAMRGSDIAIRLDVLTMRGDRKACHQGAIVLPSDCEPAPKLSRFCQQCFSVP